MLDTVLRTLRTAYSLIQSSRHPFEVGTIIRPILQMKKLRSRKVECLAPGHVADSWWNPNLSPMTPESIAYSDYSNKGRQYKSALYLQLQSNP